MANFPVVKYWTNLDTHEKNGNSVDKLRHTRSIAYSAEQVLLNKQEIWCGKTYLDYQILLKIIGENVHYYILNETMNANDIDDDDDGGGG